MAFWLALRNIFSILFLLFLTHCGKDISNRNDTPPHSACLQVNLVNPQLDGSFIVNFARCFSKESKNFKKTYKILNAIDSSGMESLRLSLFYSNGSNEYIYNRNHYTLIEKTLSLGTMPSNELLLSSTESHHVESFLSQNNPTLMLDLEFPRDNYAHIFESFSNLFKSSNLKDINDLLHLGFAPGKNQSDLISILIEMNISMGSIIKMKDFNKFYLSEEEKSCIPNRLSSDNASCSKNASFSKPLTRRINTELKKGQAHLKELFSKVASKIYNLFYYNSDFSRKILLNLSSLHGIENKHALHDLLYLTGQSFEKKSSEINYLIETASDLLSTDNNGILTSLATKVAISEIKTDMEKILKEGGNVPGCSDYYIDPSRPNYRNLFFKRNNKCSITLSNELTSCTEIGGKIIDNLCTIHVSPATAHILSFIPQEKFKLISQSYLHPTLQTNVNGETKQEIAAFQYLLRQNLSKITHRDTRQKLLSPLQNENWSSIQDLQFYINQFKSSKFLDSVLKTKAKQTLMQIDAYIYSFENLFNMSQADDPNKIYRAILGLYPHSSTELYLHDQLMELTEYAPDEKQLAEQIADYFMNFKLPQYSLGNEQTYQFIPLSSSYASALKIGRKITPQINPIYTPTFSKFTGDGNIYSHASQEYNLNLFSLNSETKPITAFSTKIGEEQTKSRILRSAIKSWSQIGSSTSSNISEKYSLAEIYHSFTVNNPRRKEEIIQSIIWLQTNVNGPLIPAEAQSDSFRQSKAREILLLNHALFKNSLPHNSQRLFNQRLQTIDFKSCDLFRIHDGNNSDLETSLDLLIQGKLVTNENDTISIHTLGAMNLLALYKKGRKKVLNSAMSAIDYSCKDFNGNNIRCLYENRFSMHEVLSKQFCNYAKENICSIMKSVNPDLRNEIEAELDLPFNSCPGAENSFFKQIEIEDKLPAWMIDAFLKNFLYIGNNSKYSYGYNEIVSEINKDNFVTMPYEFSYFNWVRSNSQKSFKTDHYDEIESYIHYTLYSFDNSETLYNLSNKPYIETTLIEGIHYLLQKVLTIAKQNIDNNESILELAANIFTMLSNNDLELIGKLIHNPKSQQFLNLLNFDLSIFLELAYSKKPFILNDFNHMDPKYFPRLILNPENIFLFQQTFSDLDVKEIHALLRALQDIMINQTQRQKQNLSSLYNLSNLIGSSYSSSYETIFSHYLQDSILKFLSNKDAVFALNRLAFENKFFDMENPQGVKNIDLLAQSAFQIFSTFLEINPTISGWVSQNIFAQQLESLKIDTDALSGLIKLANLIVNSNLFHNIFIHYSEQVRVIIENISKYKVQDFAASLRELRSAIITLQPYLKFLKENIKWKEQYTESGPAAIDFIYDFPEYSEPISEVLKKWSD